MRLHALVLGLIAIVATPSIARACEEWIPEPITLEAKMIPGLNAGTLVLTFHNPYDVPFTFPIRVDAGVIDYDGLTVELSNAHTHRTLTFTNDRTKAAEQTVTIEPRGTHVETIDLDARTNDLPRGEYDVLVTWSTPYLTASTKTIAPYRCGLAYAAERYTPPAPTKPSKLPYVLGGLAFIALLAGWRLGRRGVDDARVPHSPL